MEPVTHALASLAFAQAGMRRTTRLAAPMALCAGLAADLDLLSLAGGAEAYTAHHRTYLHSLLGVLVLAPLLAAAFVAFGRSGTFRNVFARGGEPRPGDTVRWRGALLTCCGAGLLHLGLDAMNPYGVQLLWPRRTWFALDLTEQVDPWMLAVLAVGLLIPLLLRLVTEEIGAKRENHGARRGAILALAFLAGYCGARWILHDRAVGILAAHRYHEATARKVSAYPASASPLHWMGIVETENTIEEIEFRLGGFFDADNSRTNYKPEGSAAIDAARSTEAVRLFLSFARYPSAAVVSLPEGHGVRVEIRDLRFVRPPNAEQRRDAMALVELDPQMRVVNAGLVWARDYRR